MNPETLAKLEDAARAWDGRQELRCHIAMAGIYKNAGCLPADLAIPDGDRDWARSQGVSLIEPWVTECGYFTEVKKKTLEPGDLLGFRLGRTLHHVAIMLRRGRMVHVFGHHGVKIAVCIPTEWHKRLARVWRLK